MPLPKPLLVGVWREYQLEMLFEGATADPTLPEERRLLKLVLPPWQRPEVWSENQKVRFIESVFLGLGCGYYVTNGMEWDEQGRNLPMAGWLIDGQQRITAIRDFVAGELTVFGDVTYPTMTRLEKLRFQREKFQRFELEYVDDETLLRELYDRLNFGGTPHTEDQRALPCTGKSSANSETAGDEIEIELNLNPTPVPKCKHCGRDKGNHQAQTFHCPIGRGSFPHFDPVKTYEPRNPRAKKAGT